MDSLTINRHPFCPDESKIAELRIVSTYIWLWLFGKRDRDIVPLMMSYYQFVQELYGISASLYFIVITFFPWLLRTWWELMLL